MVANRRRHRGGSFLLKLFSIDRNGRHLQFGSAVADSAFSLVRHDDG